MTPEISIEEIGYIVVALTIVGFIIYYLYSYGSIILCNYYDGRRTSIKWRIRRSAEYKYKMTFALTLQERQDLVDLLSLDFTPDNDDEAHLIQRLDEFLPYVIKKLKEGH